MAFEPRLRSAPRTKTLVQLAAKWQRTLPKSELAMAEKTWAEIEARVVVSIKSVLENPSFVAWMSNEKNVDNDDLIIVNNSFVYRDGVPTRKSADYLCVALSSLDQLTSESVLVAQPSSFNSDFKRFSVKSGNLPLNTPIRDTIGSRLHELGRLIFILIGELDDTVGASVPISHSLFDEMRFDPSRPDLARIDGTAVVVNGLADPEAVWSGVQAQAQELGLIDGLLPTGLEAPFAAAFEQLQGEVFSVLRLPGGAEAGENTHNLLQKITTSLHDEVSAYDAALARCGGEVTRDRQAYADVLRIAYNFATDAGKLIVLIVSVCDLKPMLLWCTIADHYKLAQAFRELPWIKSKKKASLARYQETIAGARNHAFHDLVPFERSVEVDVTDVSLRARRLRLFSPFSSRKTGNVLEYQDQELIDVLTQFTRAPETVVSAAFWQRNSVVMHALEDLLRATESSLKLLLGATE